MRLTFPSGDSFPVVLDFCQLPTSSYAYLQLAGNVSCHMDGKHVNCVAAKMSKKIKIFFFPVVNPEPCLALLSILGGLCGWFFFLLFLLFTFPFLYFMCVITAPVKS